MILGIVPGVRVAAASVVGIAQGVDRVGTDAAVSGGCLEGRWGADERRGGSCGGVRG